MSLAQPSTCSTCRYEMLSSNPLLQVVLKSYIRIFGLFQPCIIERENKKKKDKKMN